jgi:hypothetical protein
MDSTTGTPSIKLDVPIEQSEEPLLDQSLKDIELPEHPITASQDQPQVSQLTLKIDPL